MSDQPANRNPAGRWLKGASSPNPSGRPRIIGEVTDLARQHAPQAIETLRDIATDGQQPAQARVAAAVALLDRGYGKSPSSLDISIIKPPPAEPLPMLDMYTIEELTALKEINDRAQARKDLDADTLAEPEEPPALPPGEDPLI